MANPKGDFGEIRKILQGIAANQRRHDEVLARHDEILSGHAQLLAEHDERMEGLGRYVARHEQVLAEHDERMERVGRHLEGLANIADDLIRNKADRKKR